MVNVLNRFTTNKLYRTCIQNTCKVESIRIRSFLNTLTLKIIIFLLELNTRTIKLKEEYHNCSKDIWPEYVWYSNCGGCFRRERGVRAVGPRLPDNTRILRLQPNWIITRYISFPLCLRDNKICPILRSH